jgi:O-antigen/teichoic acid export membrane protein
MFFLISPSNILYREFAKWKGEGRRSIVARLFALRLYGGLAFCVALSLSLVALGVFGFLEKLWSVLLGWSLLLGIFLAGADREYLRLALKMRALITVTLVQKLVILGLIASYAFTGTSLSVKAVACSALLSQGLAALIAYLFTQKALSDTPEVGSVRIPRVRETLQSGFVEFAFWNHCAGVVTSWAQTMDLFFLGILGLPTHLVGLYAVALKLGNFVMAVPNALSNLFAVWVSRKSGQNSRETREGVWLMRSAVFTAALTALMGALVIGASPWIFELFSRGRWSGSDQLMMRQWLVWIVVGLVISAGSGVLMGWATLRKSMKELLLQVYLPYLILSLGLYAWAVQHSGLVGAAAGNVGVSIGFLLLSSRYLLLNRNSRLTDSIQ